MRIDVIRYEPLTLSALRLTLSALHRFIAKELFHQVITERTKHKASAYHP